MDSLRKCVTEITNSESSQALFVDRATYQGMDAGVIVIPMAMFTGMDAATTSDERAQLALALESLGTDLERTRRVGCRSRLWKSRTRCVLPHKPFTQLDSVNSQAYTPISHPFLGTTK